VIVSAGHDAGVAVKAVVFDVGGVLEVNPNTGWRRRWAARVKLAPAEFERRLDMVWGPGSIGAATLDEIERRTADVLDLDAAGVTALMNDAWDEYVGSLNGELADYFRRLRPRYKTGILSNSFVGAREREQRAHGFAEMCDVIVYSHEVGCLKPDPQIYRLVCEGLGVLPEEAVLLDDVVANVEGARTVGMRSVLFSDNHQAIADLHSALEENRR
jgi:putative hydrolase of the HAD superfamily